jgi:hypothetical protein
MRRDGSLPERAGSADARVAALLATLPAAELDALAAAMARLLVSAAKHRGPARRRVPFASAGRHPTEESGAATGS